MDPRGLFPLLSAAFMVFALVRGLRTRQWRDAAITTWFVLSFIFGAVTLWLHRQA